MRHDYQGRYDGRYNDDDYYERHSNYEKCSRFNQKLDIQEFYRRMHPSRWLKLAYSNPLNTKSEVVGYQDAQKYLFFRDICLKGTKYLGIFKTNPSS